MKSIQSNHCKLFFAIIYVKIITPTFYKKRRLENKLN